MSRRPAKITQADIARVLRAAAQVGSVLVKILPDGTIEIVQDTSSQSVPVAPKKDWRL